MLTITMVMFRPEFLLNGEIIMKDKVNNKKQKKKMKTISSNKFDFIF